MPRDDTAPSLHITGFRPNVRLNEIRELFEPFGRIRDVYVPIDYYTKTPRSFGYVQFYDRRDAEDAYHKLDGIDFDGARLTVQWAKGQRRSSHEMRRMAEGSRFSPRDHHNRWSSRSPPPPARRHYRPSRSPPPYYGRPHSSRGSYYNGGGGGGGGYYGRNSPPPPLSTGPPPPSSRYRRGRSRSISPYGGGGSRSYVPSGRSRSPPVRPANQRNPRGDHSPPPPPAPNNNYTSNNYRNSHMERSRERHRGPYEQQQQMIEHNSTIKPRSPSRGGGYEQQGGYVDDFEVLNVNTGHSDHHHHHHSQQQPHNDADYAEHGERYKQHDGHGEGSKEGSTFYIEDVMEEEAPAAALNESKENAN